MHKYLNITKMKIFIFFLLRQYMLSNSIENVANILFCLQAKS